jgi:hypothetical protein
VDENGYPTQMFFQFISDLWLRTGGATDAVNAARYAADNSQASAGLATALAQRAKIDAQGAGISASQSMAAAGYGTALAQRAKTDAKIATLAAAQARAAAASALALLGEVRKYINYPKYAGNAAAIAAGLLVGDAFYDTTDSNKLKSVVAASGGTLSITLNLYAQTKTRSGAGTVTSDAYTATVVGGSGTYAYIWEVYYGDALSAPTMPVSGSSQTWSFSLGIGETKNAKIRLTVTDTVDNLTGIVTCGFTGTETV